MKKLTILIAAFTSSLVLMAQDNGMGNHNGNSSGNYYFSGTQMLLGAILIVLIIAVLFWVFNSRRNRNKPT